MEEKFASSESIPPHDLTVALGKYCEGDKLTREKYILHAATLIEKYGEVFYRSERYHNWEDLRVDLEAECRDRFKQT